MKIYTSPSGRAMLRRDFLARLAAGAASGALGRSGGAFAYTKQRRHVPIPPPTLDRIAISTWSLHNYFRATRESTFNLPGPMLALLDFPEMIVDRYRVRHFEFCASQFPSTEPAFLRELKYALVHTQSTVVNLSVDIDQCGPDGAFSDPDHEARLAAFEAVKPWVEVAHALGAKSMSVGPGKVDPENLARTAESYKPLVSYALAKGVHVIVENQNGFGVGHPEELTKLINLAGPGRMGALPDFANFPDEHTREKGLKMLFPLAPTVCHANLTESNADAAEPALDFSQAIEIAKQSGFRGIYAIEFDGPGDPYTGIQKTLDELLKYL
jgi:sugar phosphate isomerase/epimerase